MLVEMDNQVLPMVLVEAVVLVAQVSLVVVVMVVQVDWVFSCHLHSEIPFLLLDSFQMVLITSLVVAAVVVLDHHQQDLQVVAVEHQQFLDQNKQLMDLCQLLIKQYICGLAQDQVRLMLSPHL
tara:strand:+ start:140 stop:511 length:372 start_codon:yes stop_codon:yes gene_type:complete